MRAVEFLGSLILMPLLALILLADWLGEKAGVALDMLWGGE